MARVTVLLFALKDKDSTDTGSSWESAPAPQTSSHSDGEASQTNSTSPAPSNSQHSSISDGFVRISGGSFKMGSPESENWRIADEKQHTVTVSDFYIDPYETTQWDYESLVGSNPSTFTGKKLPVDNISWLDAVNYANAKSRAAGLTLAYTVTDGEVKWDRSANGYRLPTEAEWEYAYRLGKSV